MNGENVTPSGEMKYYIVFPAHPELGWPKEERFEIMPESIAEKPKTFLLHVYGIDVETGAKSPRATLAAVPVGKDSIRYAVAMCSGKDQFSRKVGRLIAEGRLSHSFKFNGPEPWKHVGSIGLDGVEEIKVAQLFEKVGCCLPSQWSNGPIIWDIADMSFKKYIGLLKGETDGR